MTKILFDVQRDNGYGTSVYLKGSMLWSPIQSNVTEQVPTLSFEIGSGPIVMEVLPSDGFLWAVREQVLTSGGTVLAYERVVSVPKSDETIDFLDLPDANPESILGTAH